MISPLADAIQAAFQHCRDMDASLGERLDAFAASVRAISEPFADAVDRLVARLQKAEVGAGAPRVGDLLPPFHLPDEKGRIFSLGDWLSRGPVAVVVHRGHWCPYCRINTRALAQARPEIEAAGGQVVAILPDRQQYAAAIQAEAEADFPVLTDMDHRRRDRIAARAPRDSVHQGVLLEARPLARIDLSELPPNGLVVVLDQAGVSTGKSFGRAPAASRWRRIREALRAGETIRVARAP